MIKPLNSHLVILPVVDNTNEVDGVYVPKTDEGGIYRARVLAKCDSVDMVDVDDIVIVSRYIGTSINLGSEQYKLVQESQLLGKE